MGRSLRRAKKTRKKATQHRKKRPQIRAKTPLEVTQRRPSLPEKLGVLPEWDRRKAVCHNFRLNKFQDNPNASFGRNAKPAAAAAEQPLDAEDVESDDDLRAAEGKMRRSGKAPVHKLTTHQQQIMQRLIDMHGDDIEAMVRNSKLNPMLLTAGKLRAMMTAYQVHGSRGRCGFRVGRKGL